MRERTALILKIVCVGLAVALAWEVVLVARNVNPLANVTIPAVPSLPADTNAPPAVANKPPVKPGTNGPAVAMNTNGPSVAALDTNAAPQKIPHPGDTNAVASAAASASTNLSIATNLMMSPPTNAGATIVADTNAAAVTTANAARSNSPSMAVAAETATNAASTNLAVAPPTNAIVSGTNLAIAMPPGGTNLAVGSAKTNLTKSAIAKDSSARPSPGMPGMVGGPGGKPAAKLSPEIQARVDRVTESEIFAPIVRPMPMALLGIAGKVAFLRSPSGQTGMVKEGEDLGEIKLLRIGTNRVLVEQDGKKQELIIFSGLGGESLLSKTNETSDETTKH